MLIIGLFISLKNKRIFDIVLCLFAYLVLFSFEMMKSIIKSGQKDGAFAKGDAGKTAEYFLSVIYIYSVKKVNDPSCAMLTSSELERVIRG